MLRWQVLTVALLLCSCTTYSVRAPVGDRGDGLARKPDMHTVRRGDTLYSIAFLYGLSVEEVAAWNRLGPPYTIYRGQPLRLVPPEQPVTGPAPPAAPVSRPKPHPGAPLRTALPATGASQPKLRSLPKTAAAVRAHALPAAATPPQLEPLATTTTPPLEPTPAAAAGAPPASVPAAVSMPASVPAAVATPAVQSSDAHVFWSWPAEGPLIRVYEPDSAGKKGILIGGEEGQPVRAAAAGKVVYSGSGLSGYGRLIIIKHNNDFLSAYAHNRELIAKEGQWVKKGEVIAQMGNSGTDRTQLHFEIRKGGRPVDPLHHLPSRQGARVVGEQH